MGVANKTRMSRKVFQVIRIIRQQFDVYGVSGSVVSLSQ